MCPSVSGPSKHSSVCYDPDFQRTSCRCLYKQTEVVQSVPFVVTGAFGRALRSLITKGSCPRHEL